MKTKIDEKIISDLQNLPIDYWDFKKVDTKEYTHGIHSYPAVMVSPISKNIIHLMSKYTTINSLFDPFAGSGTVLVEGMLSGIKHIVGNDINPLALFIAEAKTKPLNCNLLRNEVALLYNKIENEIKRYNVQICNINDYMQYSFNLDLTDKTGWGDNAYNYMKNFLENNNININIPNFKNLGYWFKPKVIMILSIIRQEIEKISDNDIRRYVFVAFSEIIRIVSNRRNGEFKMFRMTAAQVKKHDPNVFEEFKSVLDKNIDKMSGFDNFLAKIGYNSDVKILQNNACQLNDIPDNFFDLVITSPPYGDSRTTVAYGEYSRLSLQWIDDFKLSDKEIMGIDNSLMGGTKYRKGFEFKLNSPTLKETIEKIKEVDNVRAGDVFSFYNDLDKAIEQIAKKTRKGGYHFWVVGNRTVKNEVLQTDIIISELAKQYGMVCIYTIDRNIPNKVMPSLNSPTNKAGKKSSTITMEHIVILKKS